MKRENPDSAAPANPPARIMALRQYTGKLLQSRSDMVDAAQSHIRRAKRRGITSCALAIHAEDTAGVEHVSKQLLSGAVLIASEGSLSPSTHGIIVNISSGEQLRKLLTLVLPPSTAASPALKRFGLI